VRRPPAPAIRVPATGYSFTERGRAGFFGAADDPSELHEFSSTARFSLLLVDKRHWLAAARAERAAS
jgi:hypothetical protein